MILRKILLEEVFRRIFSSLLGIRLGNLKRLRLYLAVKAFENNKIFDLEKLGKLLIITNFSNVISEFCFGISTELRKTRSIMDRNILNKQRLQFKTTGQHH